MTATWLFILLTLFVQEPTSTDAAIFLVRENHINLWLINILWLVATTIDIAVGYALGKWIQRTFQETRFGRWAEKWAVRIENFIGKNGERFTIILLGIINFPYLNAFIVSWLKLNFKNIFILIFIGDAIYWGIAWAINIGVRNYVADPHVALYVVVGIGLAFSVSSKALLNKLLKK